MNERPHGFSKQYRVCRRTDFDRIRQSNVHAADRQLVVVAARNELAHARLGLAVSRRVGNAVTRNRWKRLIREAFRLQKARLPAGLDLLVRPRRGAEPDFQAICRSLVVLARRVDNQLRRKQG